MSAHAAASGERGRAPLVLTAATCPARPATCSSEAMRDALGQRDAGDADVQLDPLSELASIAEPKAPPALC